MNVISMEAKRLVVMVEEAREQLADMTDQRDRALQTIMDLRAEISALESDLHAADKALGEVDDDDRYGGMAL